MLLVALASISCGGSAGTGGPSPSVVYGFQFSSSATTDVITVDGSVRCYEAAHNLYVSAPDSYPNPSRDRSKVVAIIIGRFHGDGLYKITESTDDPDIVLVQLLDYGGPNDYAILGRGQSGSIQVMSAHDQISGHVEGTMNGSAAGSVKGNWVCRLSAVPSGSSSATAVPPSP